MKDYATVLQELLKQQIPYEQAVSLARSICGLK